VRKSKEQGAIGAHCPKGFWRNWYKKKALEETRILGLLPRDGKFRGASSRMS